MKHGRILVVDDEEDMRGMLSFHFSNEGFTVDTACDGASGLAALEAARYDVVLLDVHLPAMPGSAVLEVVRRRWPAQRVVILSSGIDMEGGAPSWLALANGRLDKPFDIGELGRLLDELLRRPAQEGAGP